MIMCVFVCVCLYVYEGVCMSVCLCACMYLYVCLSVSVCLCTFCVHVLGVLDLHIHMRRLEKFDFPPQVLRSFHLRPDVCLVCKFAKCFWASWVASF